ncbi:LysR substrate-binding domain-containing protein [Polaromonas sp. C04]|uniref:LysR substrate-binding domain-containing protein n=1 Tax=Polaromonas sp. C04 TaxID=1945857 RepID=UPI000984BFC7|nr:LysR substrate-binding domain-containing protein [Polaromonas sp. C04]OOG50398.1 hypothetical protein B0E49_16725 [Polaromonas sp. C04]
MKLASVQAFVEVVKAGSIHAAARQLGLSQPALSKSLRALEEDLAAPLLTRSSYGVELTTYGKVFYQRAQVVIDELRKGREDVTQLRGPFEGRLTVSIAPASTMQLAPMAIVDFCRECPDVELHIEEGIWPVVSESLRDGSIDIAIGPMRDEHPPAEVVFERLLDVQMAIVLRPGHPLAGATSLRELVGGRWLHQGVGGSGSASILTKRIFADHDLPVPAVSVESRSLTATIMMLQRMDLIAVMPRRILDLPGVRDALAIVDLKETLGSNLIGLIYRGDRPLTRLAQIFAKHTRRAAAHLARERNQGEESRS